MNQPQRLYTDLASWFHLLTAPEDYAEGAASYRAALTGACDSPPRTLLELGSGGGNNASHLKAHFTMTLVDLSPEMLDLSRTINPGCEHLVGDMRDVRLGRVFDAVLIEDAIVYMTTADDLARAIETAFVHCRRGGAALFCPDDTRESFRPTTEHGGHDSGDYGLRYLEWVWASDPTDTTRLKDMTYLLREGDDVRCLYDRHVVGLFARDEWLRLISEVGFEARALPFEHSEFEPGSHEMFLGIKP
jgi:SAM-dependent methyltransferase